MPAPETIDDFLDLARKSRQVDMRRLEAYLDHQPEHARPSSPRRLAQQLVREGLMTLFQAEQLLQGKYKGFALGGYRILERIGAGGSGTVYLGEHEVMRRRVAIKVLPTPFAQDTELLERFRLEARAAAALDHVNIVRVYDFRQEGPLYFIVMEYIDGPNLQQMVNRRGPLPVPLACEYVRQAALGLAHAHERGMVHRDVKPANLLVDPTGVVKVLDLGLARYEAGGDGSLSVRFSNKLVLGTADYLAPEQALDLHSADARADLYSLGATLYTLLAGRPPFHEGSIGQKLMAHQLKEPAAVTSHRAEVPVRLAAVVGKMLAKDPAGRFQSALEAAEALAPWAEQAPRPEARSSARSMVDINLGPSTGVIASRPSAPGAAPVMETLSRAQEDTASVELEERDRERRMVPPHGRRREEEGLGWRLALFVSLVALMAGLAGGVIAFFLWGPRVM